MKVCFVFTEFDKDVSSGTIHAAYQWHELFTAFKVKEVVVINKTDKPYPKINDSYSLEEYSSLEEWFKENKDPCAYVEQNGTDYRELDLKDYENHWLIFGSVDTLSKSQISINTNGVALYAREAAAIILNEISWQLH